MVEFWKFLLHFIRNFVDGTKMMLDAVANCEYELLLTASGVDWCCIHLS